MGDTDLSEPNVLAHAKRRLFPRDSAGASYAVVDTQFAREEWLRGQSIDPEIRDVLAPFNHVRIGSGYPDLVGVRRLDSDFIDLPASTDISPMIAIEAKGLRNDQPGDIEGGVLQAYDRLQGVNAAYLVAPSVAITSEVRNLAKRLNVGVLGVDRDGNVEPIEIPKAVGTASSRETNAIRFQASTRRVAGRSFSLNHPKNYLAYPLAQYHAEDTDAILSERVVAAVDEARAGAAFLGLIEEHPEGVNLAPLGEEVVRFALERYESVDEALDEFEGWKRTRRRFCEIAPSWGQLARRVVWEYPATQAIIDMIQSLHRNGISNPTLTELFENLYQRYPTFAVELFIRGTDEARASVLDKDGTLHYDSLRDGSNYHSPTVFQLKAMFYHSGILTERGAEPHRLDPSRDVWRLENPLK